MEIDYHVKICLVCLIVIFFFSLNSTIINFLIVLLSVKAEHFSSMGWHLDTFHAANSSSNFLPINSRLGYRDGLFFIADLAFFRLYFFSIA